MQIEIAQAVEFLGRLLQPKVDCDVISTFKERLGELLKQRFTDHWDSQQPYRGNGYRAISNFNGELDPIILAACDKAACSSKLIHTHLPRDFVLWIDPYSVSYRVGDHGNIMTLYEDRSRGRGGGGGGGGGVALKMDSSTPSPSSLSPRLQYLQPISTPIRISPPSSPENKKLTKPHIHQPSPLSSSSSSSSSSASSASSSSTTTTITTTATKAVEKKDHLVMAN